MNPIFAAAYDLQAFCERAGWRFCFIGGVAVQRWGEPRFTQDADLTLLKGQYLLTCSAEDLIVHKAFADRPQDWLDIDGVVARQGAALNRQQIWFELEPLVELKEEPAILERLRARL